MKHTIAKATETLLIDKKVMKLTVKDIVEECHITRQAFYYHFANIPDLLDWIISQREEEMPEIHPGQEPSEDQLRYWSMIILNTTSHLKKMGKSAYFRGILDICFSHLKIYFTRIACKDEAFRELDPFDQDLIIRYHCYALAGILSDWDEKSRIEDLDRTLYDIYVITTGEFWRLMKNNQRTENLSHPNQDSDSYLTDL